MKTTEKSDETKTPKKSRSKCSEWEKIRRDKLNDSFTKLSKLLPSYDPSITLSKSEILHKAAIYIEELLEKIKAMGMKEGLQKTMRTEMKMLYERVKKLIMRNEQLCLFIKDAGFKVPKYYGNTKQFRRFYYTNRLTEAQATQLSKKELESQKENLKTGVKRKRNPSRNVAKRVHGPKTTNKSIDVSKLIPVETIQLHSNLKKIVSNTTSHPCFLVTNASSIDISKSIGGNISMAETVVTSSSSSAPKVSSIINPPITQPASITNLNSLGPGTLILANGSYVRILPTPTPIIIKPPTLGNLVVLTTTSTIFTKTFTNIRPKLKTAITRTTHVNKVPISSFISHIKPRKKSNTNKRKLSNKKTPKAPRKSPEEVKKVSNDSKEDTSMGVLETVVTKTTSEEVQLENNQTKELFEDAAEIVNSEKILEESNEPENVDKTTTKMVVSTASEVIEVIPNETMCKETPLSIQDKNKPPDDHLELGMNLNSELSNDIFSSLQVPIGSQNPESTSPTAAFLLAFPLVSSLTGVKVAEVIEEENSSSHNGTPTLLQIGTMDTTKTTQSESLTPNLLNLENFSFFSGFDYSGTTTTTTLPKTPVTLSKPYNSEETAIKTNFNCVQESTSVTFSKVGSVSTPYIQCENQNQQNVEHKQIGNPKPYIAVTIQNNSFNTFADFSKPVNTYSTNFTKSYTDSLYTSTNYNYNQNQYSNNQYYSKPVTTSSTGQRYNYYNTTKITQAKDKFSGAKNKNHSKAPINWMTTPDFRGNTSDYIAPPVPTFPKESDYNSTNTLYPPVVSTHTNYFNNSNTHEYQQNMQYEENQFSWSPTKMPHYLEAPHNFVATTLPTLIGDLALGTTQVNLDQNMPKVKERNKQRAPPVNYDANSGNFLSVSQLVEHKTDRSNRRNSRNIKTNQKLKKLPEATKDITNSDKKPIYPNWLDGTCTNKTTRNINKNSQSSYSAEALIGHQDLNDSNRQRYRQNFAAPPNKTLPIPTYLSDNIVPPYFPPVEITQENYIPSNQNYQNFTQNASGYLPDFSTPHDYTNSTNRPNNDCSLKKGKHKPANENLSMDFGFLSMPSSINSPILPDDFHTHTNFLPTPTPNQLYPCKNPLYSKQTSDLLPLPPVPGSRNTTQQFENIPGSSLTNFNLSAIFPEMNKSSGMYLSEPTRSKNYNFHYLGSSVQTTFHNKGNIATTSYVNATATSFASTN